MQRRTFLQQGAAAALLAAFPGAVVRGALPSLQRAENPRWYGFNLLELFSGFHPQPFREQDFEMMAEWKFNFARIPMSYWNWSKPDPAQWMKIDEEIFRLVDQVVDFGRQYGVHICLNLHRIPGYCVNDGDKEPLQLFSGPAKDQAKALEAATYHWQYIARRYKGTDSNRLSFDLINEPGSAIPAERYISVLQQLTRAIREIDPDRRIVVDGLEYGNLPVSDLAADKSIFQSTHGYAPMQLTHYQASWVWKDRKMPVPEWPLRLSASDVWDKERLRQHFRPWTALNRQGVPVHVGEWGVYNRTPHKVALAYMHDQLALWKSYGWGWSLWNLRGSFGILDSDRKDISYESYKGRRLDRKMLEVLLEGIKTPEHS